MTSVLSISGAGEQSAEVVEGLWQLGHKSAGHERAIALADLARHSDHGADPADRAEGKHHWLTTSSAVITGTTEPPTSIRLGNSAPCG
jgi:hypothetical protein